MSTTDKLKLEQSVKYYTKLDRVCGERLKGLQMKLKNCSTAAHSNLERVWVGEEIARQEALRSRAQKFLKNLGGSTDAK